jgi:hypothetical protein
MIDGVLQAGIYIGAHCASRRRRLWHGVVGTRRGSSSSPAEGREGTADLLAGGGIIRPAVSGSAVPSLSRRSGVAEARPGTDAGRPSSALVSAGRSRHRRRRPAPAGAPGRRRRRPRAGARTPEPDRAATRAVEPDVRELVSGVALRAGGRWSPSRYVPIRPRPHPPTQPRRRGRARSAQPVVRPTATNGSPRSGGRSTAAPVRRAERIPTSCGAGSTCRTT